MQFSDSSNSKRLIIFLSLLASLGTTLIYQVASYGLMTRADVMPMNTTYSWPPRIESITPSSVPAGSPDTTITINGPTTGSGFNGRSVIFWRRTSGQVTSYNIAYPNQLRATIPASALTTARIVDIVVSNPDSSGLYTIDSAPVQFIITPSPIPAITGISPSTALQGSTGFLLTINGTGFTSSSTIRWNGVNIPTNVINSNRLTASIPASYLIVAQNRYISVFNPLPGGVSNSVQFTVTPSTTSPATSPSTPLYIPPITQ